MALVQQLLQLLIAVCGATAGFIALLIAITRLLSAVVDLRKEIASERRRPRRLRAAADGAQLAGGLQRRLGLQPVGDPERFLQDVAGNYQLLRRRQQLES